MKRSQINAIIHDLDAPMKEHRFHLPALAHRSPDTRAAKEDAVQQIVERSLCWDVTDFGRGDFRESRFAAFTPRNGSLEDLRADTGKLVLREGVHRRREPGHATPLSLD